MDRAEFCTCQHRNSRLGDHRHIEDDPVTLLDVKLIAEKVGHLVDLVVKLTIGEDTLVAVVPLEDDRGFVFASGKMASDALISDVELTPLEPLIKWCIIFVEYAVKRLVPVDFLPGKRFPSAFVVVLKLLHELVVLAHIPDRGVRKKLLVGIKDLVGHCVSF